MTNYGALLLNEFVKIHIQLEYLLNYSLKYKEGLTLLLSI